MMGLRWWWGEAMVGDGVQGYTCSCGLGGVEVATGVWSGTEIGQRLWGEQVMRYRTGRVYRAEWQWGNIWRERH